MEVVVLLLLKQEGCLIEEREGKGEGTHSNFPSPSPSTSLTDGERGGMLLSHQTTFILFCPPSN
jgi:hypothetical protein